MTKVKGSDLQRLVNPRYKTDADQNLDGKIEDLKKKCREVNHKRIKTW